MRSKGNSNNFKEPTIKTNAVKAVAVKNEVIPIFFLEGADESFLAINKFPYGKVPLPEVGELVNLSVYGDFEFDYFVIKEKFYRYFFEKDALCVYVYFTVAGEFESKEDDSDDKDWITVDPDNPSVGIIE